MEAESVPAILSKKTWLFFIGFFCLNLIFFLAFSPFQFLDGDDAMEAIYALAGQNHLNPFQFPLHGYQTRAGAFGLIYLFSFVTGSPQLSFAILSALSASLSLAILPLYSCLVLGLKPRAVHGILVFCSAIELVYAGLYPNAAIIGYSLAFLSIFLSLLLLEGGKKYYFYFISGALYGLSLSASASAAYLCLTFPLQHFFFRKDQKLSQAIAKFSLEIISGLIAYLAAQSLMGLSLLSPFREFQDVYVQYSGALINYTVITFLGAFTASVISITLIAFSAMAHRRRFPALWIGSADFLLFPLVMGIAFKTAKSFQHSLAMYILVCFSVIYIYELIRNKYLKCLYVIFLILPLIIGIRLYLPEQPYRGPGFSELDPGRALTLEEKDQQGLGGFRLRQSPKIMVKGRGVRLALGSGFMLPSVDGGRALQGQLWAWTVDWKKYLDDLNQPYQVIVRSGENDLVMGQFAAGAVTMYNLVRDGYRPSYIYWRDFYFTKGGRVIRNYWYFNLFLNYVDKREMSLQPLPESVQSAVLVTSPSFAFRLESRSLSLPGFSYQPLGHCCFRINKISDKNESGR